MNEYQRMMEDICVPEELNRRVFSACCQNGAVHRVKKHRAVWRMAASALAAVLLVAGGISLRPRESTMEYNYNEELEIPELYLGLPAKAVGLGANGGILLDSVEGHDPAALEGTTRTLSLTFADGREETGIYYLRTEKLKTFLREDGSEELVPALEGDPAETVTGLYGVSAEESRWFLWPVEGSSVVSLSAPYGLRAGTDYFHSGIDIPAERGTVVTAAAGGTVREAGVDTARGNYLILDHGDGLTTLYGHCQELRVKAGDTVEAGTCVALVGATGMATGPHLHFEVRQDGEAQNPVAYFTGEIRDTLTMG